ncbi:MAG: hypothetical protein CL569_05810 [Alphaproteobacteria bacterium]|nr:hypothetical protein [Alphaproteobacteria bacterium]
MINRIKKLFSRIDSGDVVEQDSAEAHAMAAAVLMVEAARLDGDFDASERQSIRSLVTRHFGLEDEEADDLIAEAEAIHDDTNHLVRLTRTIKDSYPPEERIAIIEMLWEVVYADGVLHDYEANLLRRIGGLIYVSDRDRGAARKRVTDRLGIERPRTSN